MKNVFAILAGFVLLAPAILASPAPFPGGDGENHVCLPKGAPCGGEYDKLKCCGECKEQGGKDKYGHSKSFCHDKKPEGGNGGHGVCLPVGAECGGDKGKCCGNAKCKESGEYKRGLPVSLCCDGGKGGSH